MKCTPKRTIACAVWSQWAHGSTGHVRARTTRAGEAARVSVRWERRTHGCLTYYLLSYLQAVFVSCADLVCMECFDAARHTVLLPFSVRYAKCINSTSPQRSAHVYLFGFSWIWTSLSIGKLLLDAM